MTINFTESNAIALRFCFGPCCVRLLIVNLDTVLGHVARVYMHDVVLCPPEGIDTLALPGA